MKIINKLKQNWKEGTEREAELKRLKDIEKSKKPLKLSDDDVKEIIKLIGEQNPAWAELEPEILALFLKLAIKQFKPTADDFNISDSNNMRQKVADIFNGQNDKVVFNVGGNSFKPNAITPAQVKQLNDAYAKGKNMGSGFTKGLKSLFKKQTKHI
jgi:mRNA-degrading endonuclease HigB of HigAB toxin-antitoxin module